MNMSLSSTSYYSFNTAITYYKILQIKVASMNNQADCQSLLITFSLSCWNISNRCWFVQKKKERLKVGSLWNIVDSPNSSCRCRIWAHRCAAANSSSNKSKTTSGVWVLAELPMHVYWNFQVPSHLLLLVWMARNTKPSDLLQYKNDEFRPLQ